MLRTEAKQTAVVATGVGPVHEEVLVLAKVAPLVQEEVISAAASLAELPRQRRASAGIP